MRQVPPPLPPRRRFRILDADGNLTTPALWIAFGLFIAVLFVLPSDFPQP